MPFKVKKGTISNKSWGEIDKAAIWQKLKAGLAEGAEGTVEAVKEMYAVVKAEINKDLTQKDCFMPHHEIQQDGSLVINRGGVIAAVAASRGARAEPNLTAEQRAQAEAHLKRHYTELEMPWPEGEISAITANITGEIVVEDVPLAPGVNLAALKANDDDPLEVIVEIPAGKSRRGWNYTSKVIQKIASEVMTKTVAGFLGHQKPDDVDYQFPMPATHWVGALYRDGKTYVRGVVDKAADNLKRWIRAGRITQTSIFGIMETEQAGGETQVTDINLLSIDWVPLDRAGMATRIVAVGEMDSIVNLENQNGGGKTLTLQELLAELRKINVKPGQVVGEMGWDVKTLAKELDWKLDEIAGEINAEQWNQLQEKDKTISEISQVFGLKKDAKLKDLVALAREAREAQTKTITAEQEKLIDKVIGEMVVAETARPLIKMMLQVPVGADEVAIKKAVGEILEQDTVKAALAGVFKSAVITPKIGREDNNNSGLRVKRVSI